MWTKQDTSRRQLRDGDYLVVKVKKINLQQAVQEQWRSANGVCINTGDSEYTTRLLNWGNRRHRRHSSEEGEEHLGDNVSLLQTWRTSFVKHAQHRLQPPGNGMRGVSFDDHVDMEGTMEVDLSVTNRFIQAFCETRQEEELNVFSKDLMKEMRLIEKMNSQTSGDVERNDEVLGVQEQLNLLPLIREEEEEPIDGHEPVVLKLGSLITLPIREEEPARVHLQLQDLLPFGRSSILNTYVDQGCFSQNFDSHGSTAVILTNPRLHELQHVHGRFVECEGIGELAERVTTPGGIVLEKELLYPELMKPELKGQIKWEQNELADYQNYQDYEIYTDGSKLWCVSQECHTAGWAVVIVGVTQQGEQKVIGTLAGRVVTDRDDPLCMGAMKEDSDTAEIEAVIWATLWALQAGEVLNLGKCTIVSDSFTKVMAAEGKWKSPNTPQSIVMLNLMMALQQRVNVETRWTRAHRGDLHNELADHLAKCAARFPEQVKPTVDNYQIMEFGDALQWLWVAMKNDGRHGVLPFRDQLCFRAPDPLQNYTFFTEREVLTETKQITIKLNVASFNINTIGGRNGGLHKEAVLLRHLAENKIAVTGLQETRRKQSREWQRGDYFGFSSASQGGQGGIDIVFNKKLPFAMHRNKPIFFEPAACTVLFEEPQMMAVQMKSDWVKLVFVSVHAPHDAIEEEVKETFWRSLSKRLENITSPVFLMIDANAKMGSTVNEHIGGAFAEPPNSNTPYMEEMIKKLSLWLPSTMHENIQDMDQEQGTWHHRSGLSRIDFIGLPLAWKRGLCKTTPQDVEFAESYKDHRLVMAKIEVEIDSMVSKRSRRSEPDRQAMCTKEGKETIAWLAKSYLENSTNNLPRAGDQLLGNYEAYMNDQLLRWFPKEEAAWRPSWTTKRHGQP